MQLKTNALVLKPRTVGENDVILTLLTEARGVTEATVRGSQRKKSAYSVLCQPFCYAKLELFQGKSTLLVDQFEIIDAHFALSSDPFAAALAAYCCEILRLLAPGAESAKDYLQLTLNSFWMLTNGKRDLRLLKAIFELRAMVYAGFAPNLVACKDCGRFEDDIMYFFPREGTLLCKECVKKRETAVDCFPLNKAVLNAMRYIVYGSAKKIFSFTLKDPSLHNLCRITEDYLIACTEADFHALNVLKALYVPLETQQPESGENTV